MTKRPKYLDGIGVFIGTNSATIWVKIHCPHGARYNGRTIVPNNSLEIKLGKLTSWSWKEALQQKDKLQGLADRGEPLQASPLLLFSDYATEWLEGKKGSVRGLHTLKGHIHTDLIPAFGNKDIQSISVRDINRWQLDLQKRGNKDATIIRKRNTLSAILNRAISEDILTDNPVKKAAKLDAGQPRLRIPSNEEVKTVIQAAMQLEADISSKSSHNRHPWLVDLLRWSILSGMRRGESLNTRLSDVQTTPDGKTLLLVKKTKSQKARLITCNAGMTEIIEKVRSYDRITTDDRLFAISVGRASKVLAELWRVCGVEDIRLHDLRRLHSSTLIKSGIDTKTVASRIGHSSLAMLEKHYAVFMGDGDAADSAQKAFEGMMK